MIARMPRLVLHNFWRSSSSQRVRIALGLKGLDYDYVSVNLTDGEQSSDAHRARSPTAYVPCLVVDDVTYVESVAIIEFLDERFPAQPLYPKDPHGRARVRALVEIINSGTQPLQNLRIVRHLAEIGQDGEGQKAWLRHFIGLGLASFERGLEATLLEGVSGRHAYGDAPTAADAFLVPQMDAARRFHVDLAPYPRVREVYEAAMRLEPFQRAAPERQPDAPKK